MKNTIFISLIALFFLLLTFNSGMFCKSSNTQQVVSSNSDIKTTILVATNKGLSISYDNMNTWTNHNTFGKKDHSTDEVSYNIIKSVYYYNGKIYCGSEKRLNISSNDGKTWNELNFYDDRGYYNSKIFEIIGNKDTIYVAFGYGVTVSYDNGETWLNKDKINMKGQDWSAYTVFIYGEKLYIGNEDGLYIKDLENASNDKMISSIYDKELWCYSNDILSSALSSSIYDIFVKDETIYLARGCGIQISNDDGNTWKKYSRKEIDNAPIQCGNVYVDNDNIIYASTFNGISISADNGKTWKNYPILSNTEPYSTYNFHIINRNNIYVATWEGLKVTHDGGETWETYGAKDGLCSDNIIDVFVYEND